MSWSSGMACFMARGGTTGVMGSGVPFDSASSKALVSGGCPGYLELANLIRKSVRGKRGRSIRHLEVQVGHNRIAGVTHQPDHLAKVDFFTATNLDASRLHMGVQRIALIAQDRE